MRSLYINYEAFRRNDSQLIVRNRHHQVKYLINSRWGNQLGKIIISSLNGDELLTINQLTTGKVQKFEIRQGHCQISTFRRILNNYDRPLYLKKIHWLIWGNQHQLKYRIIDFQHMVMKSTVTTKIPRSLKLSINQCENEPLCVGMIALLNYWATLNDQVSSHPFSTVLNHRNQNELA